MAKDYAKKSSSYSSRSKSSAAAPARWPWFITGLILGVVGTFAITYYQTTIWQWLNQTSSSLSEAVLTSTNPESKVVAKKPEPQFDFYNMLPNMEVAKPTPPSKPQAAEAVRTPTEQPQSSQQYVIQAGSFLQAKDAEQMKAELILAGFNVQITTFTKDTKTWYRVLLGPYESANSAKRAQQQLQAQNINTLLIKS